jgi:hypothetical protein
MFLLAKGAYQLKNRAQQRDWKEGCKSWAHFRATDHFHVLGMISKNMLN